MDVLGRAEDSWLSVLANHDHLRLCVMLFMEVSVFSACELSLALRFSCSIWCPEHAVMWNSPLSATCRTCIGSVNDSKHWQTV